MPTPRTARTLLVGLITAAAASGCSFSASIGGGYDVDTLEGAIQDLADENFVDFAPHVAECGDDLPDPAADVTFTCTVTDAEGNEGTATITGQDDEGNVDIQIQ